MIRSIYSLSTSSTLVVSSSEMVSDPQFTVPPKIRLYYHLTICTTIARFLGLNNSPGNILDWCIVPLVTVLYCTGCIVSIFHLNILFAEHVTIILRIVESIQLVLGFFVVLISTLNSFNVHGALSSIMTNLNQIDIELASLQCRAVNMKYRLVIVLIQLVSYYILVLGLLLGHVFVQHEIVRYEWLYFSIRFFPLLVIGSIVLLFSNIVLDIQFRLQSLNDLIEKHLNRGHLIPDRHFHIFRVVYELSFEVCRTLNATLSLCNLFQIGFCFISITAKTFFIFITLTNLADATVQDMSKFRVINCNDKFIIDFLSVSFPWLFVLIVPIIILSRSGQMVKDEAKRMVILLYRAHNILPPSRDYQVII